MLQALGAATAPFTRDSARLWILAAAACLALAAALRTVAAQGDLWLDEIWSLTLIREAGSLPGILFGISHDNNHYLNSIWLYLAGPDAPVLLQRALSIVLGASSVLAAGFVFKGDRRGQLVMMALVAVAAPLVQFGSEARGYAGLALFSFLTFALTARLLDGPDTPARIAMAAVTALGLLSHLTFAAAVGIAGLWMVIETWRNQRSLRIAERATLQAFTPALIAMVAVAACFVTGALQHGFTIGGVTPFSVGGFIDGYGGLMRELIGLPAAVPAALVLTATGAALVVALVRPGLIDRRFAPLYLVGLVLVPTAMMLARLPNTGFGRYFLVSGVVFLIFVVDMLRHGLRGGRLVQAGSVLLLGLSLTGNAMTVASWAGRVRYSDAVSLMARDGAFTYGSDSPFRTDMTLGYHAKQLGVSASPIPVEDWCVNRPDWLVLETPLPADESGASNSRSSSCQLAVERAAAFPLRGPSGLAWTIYRVRPRETAQ